jgi:lipopolysaccharide/colanic/teichoic acid biosynthesis glycosyltransferase
VLIGGQPECLQKVIVDPFLSNHCAGRDADSQSGEQQPAPRFGNKTTASDQPSFACENNPKIITGIEIGGSISGEISCWKRILDLTCILASLPCWLTLMICITLWIKVTSPGPIFYRQERVGYRGRRFTMFKFRTMKPNIETASHERHLEQLMQTDCPMMKLDAAGDPRIIPGGRVLRATGLDELPQLLNVLRGEMSLVGPRPCTIPEYQLYQAWQKERLNAPPGLTGYWQVNGKNKTTFTEMINLDIVYARKMSTWLDLAIMLRTPGAVIVQLFENSSGLVVGAVRKSLLRGSVHNKWKPLKDRWG